MNVVLIIPTGIGAEIGGHAGDGNPIAKLIASACDVLITHPNVVNASDINEMTDNTLYVEGSILDRFLGGEIGLKRVKQNKILVAVNPPVDTDTINAVSAARATIGIDAFILELKIPLKMIVSFKPNGQASGMVSGWRRLIKQVNRYQFDALAITSPIEVEKEIAINYLRNGGVNPWGGVEAKASKLIADGINKPIAHSPYGDPLKDFKEIVDPRMAAEMVSITYLHSVLKGLHRAPRIGKGLSATDIDCLITPAGCVGVPHKACLDRDIPVIAVKQNKTILNDPMPDEFIFVENYLEAAGVLIAMRAGVSPESISRPLKHTLTR